MTLLLKYRGGSENEVSGSAQPWDSTIVPGDIVDCEHGGNGREFWEGDECYGMHWTCIERLWPPEIAVERSRMSRKRRIAVDKPPDMLGACEKIG